MANESGCEVLIINKDDYNNIIKRYDKRRQKKTEFMKQNIPFLDCINSPEIWEDLFYLLKEQEFPKNTVLAEEGSPGHHLYFIKDGYCTLEKTFSVDYHYKTGSYEKVSVKREIATLGVGSALGTDIFLG